MKIIGGAFLLPVTDYLLPKYMSRSSKKGPYVDQNLIGKIQKMEAEGRKETIRTWARNSDVSPEMVGHTIAVHKGNGFIEVFITESMVGHKLGEFAPTRKFVAHSRKGYEGEKKKKEEGN